MEFISTRNSELKVSPSYAIAYGISQEGGLFVPSSFPKLTKEDFEKLLEMDYPQRAAYIISMYLTDFTYDELYEYTKKAYARFSVEDPAPVVKIGEGEFMLELIYGPTLAFKDIALTLLPYLLSASAKKQNIQEKILILTATSGDTGKAALEGFKDVDGTNVMVFYPSDGVAKLQKLQMATTKANNVYVAAVNGNFDDCQSAVKRAFTNKDLQKKLKDKGFVFSSANSINFGRLVPQIVYYISSYLDLVNANEISLGDNVNFVVPTGNFGNILAGFYAKQMGIKINKLVCASNKNNILTDFFTTGDYDLNRDFFKTMSPSMDILISSNLERLLFELSGRDSKLTTERMNALKTDKKYSLTAEEKAKYDEIFYAGCTNEDQTIETIEGLFEANAYCMDTHTAVAKYVYDSYKLETGDNTKTVIVSTASPYKFASDVLYAITADRVTDPFKAMKKLMNQTAIEMPESLATLKDKPVLFNDVINESDIDDLILKQVDKF